MKFFTGQVVRWLVVCCAMYFCVSCGEDAAGGGSSADGGDEPVETILFGVYTADKASKVVEQMAPVIARMEKRLTEELGRPIKIQMRVAPDYTAGVEDLVEGRVQFSRLGPASFINAMKMNPELKLLAMEARENKRTFRGVIAVHRDSEIQSIGELRGKSFAFGNAHSTIGRFLVQARLLEVGIDASGFRDFDYLGRHDKVGMAVAAGEYAGGALKETTFDRLVDAGEPLRVLEKFENVTKPWVYHPSLKPDIAEGLRRVMLEMPGCKPDRVGFLHAEERYYDVIRDAMATAQAF